MNDHRIQQRLPAILVTVLSVFFAIYAGSVIGAGQTRTLLLIAAGASFIALGLSFRAGIWLLIPLFWNVTGGLPLLGVPFSVRDLAVLVSFTWVLIFFAVRIIRTKAKFDLLDFILFLNLLLLLVAFIRNPVGTRASGSDMIGGRPYFDTAIAVAAFFVFTHAKMSEKLALRLPLLILTPAVLLAILGVASYFSPRVGSFLELCYSGLAVAAERGEIATANSSMVRLNFLSGCGSMLFLYLACRFPLRSLINPLNPFRCFFLLLSLACILFSGFRSVLIGCALMSIVIAYYRGMKRDAVVIIAMGVVAAAFLVGIQGNLVNLPLSVQRTLSFLPGNWSEEAEQSAAHSTEWRLYMWKAMLQDDKYVKDRLLGDGFGFSQRLFASSVAAQDMGRENSSQEHYLITGEVHSGPLSTIRIVGIVGLALYLWLAITLSIRVHRLLKEARSTPYAFAVFFLTIPIVIHPLLFVFVFGSYHNNFPNIIYWVGLFKLLESAVKRFRARAREDETSRKRKPVALFSPGLPRLHDLRPPLPQR